LIRLAGGMHLSVDDARHDPSAPRIEKFARGWRCLLAEPGDFPAGHCHEAIVDDPIRENDVAAYHKIEVRHV